MTMPARGSTMNLRRHQPFREGAPSAAIMERRLENGCPSAGRSAAVTFRPARPAAEGRGL